MMGIETRKSVGSFLMRNLCQLFNTEWGQSGRQDSIIRSKRSDRVGVLQAWFMRTVYRWNLHKARKICWVKPGTFPSSRFTFCTRLSIVHVGGRYAENVPLMFLKCSLKGADKVTRVTKRKSDIIPSTGSQKFRTGLARNNYPVLFARVLVCVSLSETGIWNLAFDVIEFLTRCNCCEYGKKECILRIHDYMYIGNFRIFHIVARIDVRKRGKSMISHSLCL